MLSTQCTVLGKEKPDRERTGERKAGRDVTFDSDVIVYLSFRYTPNTPRLRKGKWVCVAGNLHKEIAGGYEVRSIIIGGRCRVRTARRLDDNDGPSGVYVYDQHWYWRVKANLEFARELVLTKPTSPSVASGSNLLTFPIHRSHAPRVRYWLRIRIRIHVRVRPWAHPHA